MKVHVSYEYDLEVGTWSVDSNVPGYMAVASTLDELRRLVHEGIPFFLERDDIEIIESGPEVVPLRVTRAVDSGNTSGATVRTNLTRGTSVPAAPVG